MSFGFGIFLVFVGSGLVCAEKCVTTYRELSENAYNGALLCMSELNASVDVCSDMLDNTCDLNDSKYDGCKCLIPCVGKIIGVMNVDDGKWNETAYRHVVSLLEIREWRQEAELIGIKCEDRTNTHCSAGYPLFRCATKHSKMLQNMTRHYTDQKQRTSNADDGTDVEYIEE